MNETFEQTLNTHLNKIVELTMIDNEILTGCLRTTNDETLKHHLDLCVPKNYYFLTEDSESKTCSSYLFKPSRVKKIKGI